MNNKKTYYKIALHLSVFLFFALPLISYAAGLVPCGGKGEDQCKYEHFTQLIVNVVNFAIQLGIAFSAVVFAWAGWLYMTSGGDEGKLKEAHELFIKVLWGFLFALGAFLIVQLITKSLGLDEGIVKI
jgi:hypothetical protein